MSNCEAEIALAACVTVRVVLKVIIDKTTKKTHTGNAKTNLKLEVGTVFLFMVFFTILKIG